MWQHWGIPHTFPGCSVWWQISSTSMMVVLESCHQTCMTYTSAECTVQNSWWWAEKPPETCSFLTKINLEKLVRLLVLLKGRERERERETDVWFDSVTLNMKALRFSVISVYVYQWTRHCILQNLHRQQDRFENPVSNFALVRSHDQFEFCVSNRLE